jgi:hypothetical protein
MTAPYLDHVREMPLDLLEIEQPHDEQHTRLTRDETRTIRVGKASVLRRADRTLQ